MTRPPTCAASSDTFLVICPIVPLLGGGTNSTTASGRMANLTRVETLKNTAVFGQELVKRASLSFLSCVCPSDQTIMTAAFLKAWIDGVQSTDFSRVFG